MPVCEGVLGEEGFRLGTVTGIMGAKQGYEDNPGAQFIINY
jgi:hypothetical protein